MWNSEHYTIAAMLLPQLLGLIYFFAFFPFLFQISGLIGQNGILPASQYLDYFRSRINFPKQWFVLPTLFWLNAGDWALRCIVILGVISSIFLTLGVFPSLFLALLFILYLSIITVGQDFLSFGWESFLLEITFYTFWISLTDIPHPVMWFCLTFLLFRFFIQVGTSKLQSRDICWKDLSALAFHYETQPLPNTLSWYAHKLPKAFQKVSTFFMFVVELFIPFALFLTEDLRALAGFSFILLQLIIYLTGNFSYLNHLTAAFSVIAFPNALLPFVEAPLSATPLWLDLLLTVIGTIFIAFQVLKLWIHFYPHPMIENFLRPFFFFHLVNGFQLFSVMTKKRFEIIVEGSEDGKIWKEYLFKYKPSEISRRPRRISPYQPRLDWQMWFLPFDDFESEQWFQQFLYHLLKGTPEVLKLVRENPFNDSPPKYIRALMYDYHFSTKEEKKKEGIWWTRELLGQFSPVLMLKS